MKTKAKTLTDRELDEILSSVENALSKAEKMSKADEDAMESAPEQEAPGSEPMQPEAPAPEAPAEEAPAPEAPAPEAPAPEHEMSESPDKELAEESAGGDEISDEELNEIYGSMAPEELERHYMIIRTHLKSLYGEGEGGEAPAPEAPAEEAPAPEAPAPEAPAMAPEAPAPEEKPEMGKSEDIAALRKQNEELAKSVDSMKREMALALKAVELLAKPKRKSIEGIEFVSKAEPTAPKLSDRELKEKANEFARKPSLSKSERELLSDYVVSGKNRESVEKLILGGK